MNFFQNVFFFVQRMVRIPMHYECPFAVASLSLHKMNLIYPPLPYFRKISFARSNGWAQIDLLISLYVRVKWRSCYTPGPAAEILFPRRKPHVAITYHRWSPALRALFGKTVGTLSLVPKSSLLNTLILRPNIPPFII